MIGIIIGTAVAGVFIFFLAKEWKKENIKVSNKVALVFLAIASGLLVATITDSLAFVIFKAAATTPIETTEKVASVELVALQDNSTVTGQFFLGSGSVNNKTHYAFYYETENGYKYETLDAESATHPVYIKHANSDAESAHIDRYAIIRRNVYTATVDPAWFSFLAKLEYFNTKAGEVVSEKTLSPSFSSEDGYYDNFRYEICIPEGSIKEGYTIDLE